MGIVAGRRGRAVVERLDHSLPLMGIVAVEARLDVRRQLLLITPHGDRSLGQADRELAQTDCSLPLMGIVALVAHGITAWPTPPSLPLMGIVASPPW